ncbi:MAG: alcohol dehydrogenase catalytic domain-containing protein, partial [Propionibacteriaceae bacterium]|nr:alcohol dehydrogenase catalytic domain-containing protein [Propionibacteriaceae bacterium]
MRAAWYTRGGTASEVLTVGERPDPTPAPGEVRVRLAFSGINPGDTKKREDWQGLGLPFPLVIPHSDGAGVVDAVGAGVASGRVGERVWVWGAQSYRAFGTAAEFVCVPDAQAVVLPGDASLEVGACLGIPGITAHRCMFADGPVTGRTVLVQGALGGVGRLAALLARAGGARVIGSV